MLNIYSDAEKTFILHGVEVSEHLKLISLLIFATLAACHKNSTRL